VVNLLSDGQNLYFTDAKSVYRLPVAGGAVETLTHGFTAIRRLALDASNLYFSDDVGGIMKLPK